MTDGPWLYGWFARQTGRLSASIARSTRSMLGRPASAGYEMVDRLLLGYGSLLLERLRRTGEQYQPARTFLP